MERLSLGRWASPWLRRQHLARYQWAAGMAAGARVLDAACGSGYGTRILAGGGAARVEGLDHAEEAIEEARRDSAEIAHFLLGDVTQLPLRSGAYDVYVSFETIEHLADDRAYASEAARVLQPGGRLLCSTPNRGLVSPGRSLADRPDNPFHVREYVLEEMDAVLSPFFRSVEYAGQTPFSPGYSRLVAILGRASSRLALRLHQLRKILGLLGERKGRHSPVPLGDAAEPEVLIALCTK